MNLLLSILLWAVVILMVGLMLIMLTLLLAQVLSCRRRRQHRARTTPLPNFYRFWCPRCQKVTRHKYIGHGTGFTDGIYYPGYSCEENNCYHELILYPYRDYSKPGHPVKAR